MFERKMLARAGLGDQFDLQCCGPGAAGVEAWMNSTRMIHQPVILAGLAGGLTKETHAGRAWMINEVIDRATDQRWRPNWPEARKSPFASITSTDRTVTTTEAKIELQQRTGADLVDLESVAFARAASNAGWTWALVRGVSDPLQSSLPANIDEWVDSEGRTRTGIVARSLLLHPWHIPAMIGLGTRSNRAMNEVASILKSLLASSSPH